MKKGEERGRKWRRRRKDQRGTERERERREVGTSLQEEREGHWSRTHWGDEKGEEEWVEERGEEGKRKRRERRRREEEWTDGESGS